jgi:hypothetical protein
MYRPKKAEVQWEYSIIYIQQDATLHSLFYLETALHVSGGIITHRQERKQLYLQHLVFVTLLLLPAAVGYISEILTMHGPMNVKYIESVINK